MKKLMLFMAICLFAGVSFGQTIRNGAILEFHHFALHLDPDVTMNQYLDFLANVYIPAVEELMEGRIHVALLDRVIRGQGQVNS